jgi:hypothetical protein
MYYGYYNPDKKQSSAAKLNDAINRYIDKHGTAPTVALVNASDFDGLQGRDDIEIRVAGTVARNVYFIGCESWDGVLS